MHASKPRPVPQAPLAGPHRTKEYTGVVKGQSASVSMGVGAASPNPSKGKAVRKVGRKRF